MLEVTFLLVTHFNSGDPVPKVVVQRFEDHLLDNYGGFTCDGSKLGGWRDDHGRTYVETSYHYRVKLDSLTDGGNVRETVLFVLSACAQETVAFTYEGRVEILCAEDVLPANAVLLRAPRPEEEAA